MNYIQSTKVTLTRALRARRARPPEVPEKAALQPRAQRCLILRPKYILYILYKRPSGAFCLRQNAQRAALRAAGQATSGKRSVRKHLVR